MKEKNSNAGWQGMHGVVFFALLIAASCAPPLRVWPWPWVAPLGAYFVLVALVPPLKGSFHRPRFGEATPIAIGATAIIIVVSCGVLVAFHVLRHPDMHAYAHALPIGALGGAVTAGICFSVVNAFLEELVFRGVLFEAVASQWSSWAAVCATAALFGYGHLRGYPPGAMGAVLAGIYGFALGWLRMVTRGLGLPVIAHIAADATIFSIMARSGGL